MERVIDWSEFCRRSSTLEREDAPDPQQAAHLLYQSRGWAHGVLGRKLPLEQWQNARYRTALFAACSQKEVAIIITIRTTATEAKNLKAAKPGDHAKRLLSTSSPGTITGSVKQLLR